MLSPAKAARLQGSLPGFSQLLGCLCIDRAIEGDSAAQIHSFQPVIVGFFHFQARIYILVFSAFFAAKVPAGNDRGIQFGPLGFKRGGAVEVKARIV